MTLDSDILVGEISDYLPNNGSRYKIMNEISTLPTGTSAKLYTPSVMYLCVFIAENGSVNINTKMQEGIWKCLGSKAFVTS
jgi:hypothetical protein